MNSDILLDAIGIIDDEIIEDAGDTWRYGKKRVIKLALAAACVCVVIGAGFVINQINIYNVAIDMMQSGAHCNGYPYSDREVLDYVGSPLENLDTAYGTIVFNEITDIEMYRKLNSSAYAGEIDYGTYKKAYYSEYYDTDMSCDKYVGGMGYRKEEFELSEYRGVYEYGISKSAYERTTEQFPVVKALSEYFAKDTLYVKDVSGEMVALCDVAGIYTRLLSSEDCDINLIMGKNLDILGERVAALLEPMRKMLGTEKSSVISGEEVAVQYFYRQRIHNNDETRLEECYIYYVYVEMDDMQYLYQFTSKWTVPGSDVGLFPNTSSGYRDFEAISQEEAREKFAKVLGGIIKVLQEDS